jgi:biopolymer transport protein ExbB
MNVLVETVRAGGPLMIPLAALCLGISFWVAAIYPRLRRACRSVPGVLGCLEAGSRNEVLSAVHSRGGVRPGLPWRAVGFALAGPAGGADLRARFEEARQAELPRFEREARVLQAMVAAAPLVGLLGTVKGMIETFLGLSARGSAMMDLLSSGVSEALVTTQVGLIVALPGLVGLHAIRRKIARLETDLDRIGAKLAPLANGEALR